jgi:hypothetical protein
MTELPACHSRRVLELEPGVYFCAHPRMHAPDSLVDAGICLACRYWRESAPAVFREFPPAGPLRRRGNCRHLGELIELRECRGCRGNVRVKVFACRHPAHTETTMQYCRTCRDFVQITVLADT